MANDKNRSKGTASRRKAEEKLTEHEENYRRILEIANEGILMADTSGKITFANPKMAEMLGYTIEELVGRPGISLVSPPEQPSILNKMEKRKDGAKEEYEVRFRRRDGGELLVHASGTPIYNSEGQHIGNLGMYVDITERKVLEESLKKALDTEELNKKRLEIILKIIPSGVVIIEKPDGRITYVNDRAIELYGTDPRGLEIAHHSSNALKLKLLKPDGAIYPPEELPASRALLHGEEVSGEEIIIERPDGSRIVASASAIPLLSNNGEVAAAAIGIFHDITKSKLVQQELDMHRLHLEKMVSERTAKLKKSNRALEREAARRQQAEEQLRALSNRIASIQEEERRTIAYELHEQIGQSLSLVKLLLDRAVKSPERTASILSEANELVRDVIGQIRNISLELRPSMLDNLGLLPALLWLFEWYGSRTNLRVIFKENGLQDVIPGQVSTAAYRIVQESLSNVIRHSGASEVTVSTYEKGGILSLRIKDRGRGFDTALLASSASTGLNGMRERAQLLGGKLTVKSCPGTGTIISCKLPLSPPPAHEGD